MTMISSQEPANLPMIPKLGIKVPILGIRENPKMAIVQPSGLARALFSQVQLRVLSLFFSDPSRRLHLAQVIRFANSGRGAVQRELEKLTQVGILTVTSAHGRKIYQANRQSPIFDEVRGIIIKTVGLVEPIQKALKSFASRIRVAFVFGSVAKGSDTTASDVDLMILGRELVYGEIYKALQKAENEILRTINPNIMTPGEWEQKLKDRNSFAVRIAQQPKLFVLGDEDEFQRTG
jgi:predicted nucleotidyltransferase